MQINCIIHNRDNMDIWNCDTIGFNLVTQLDHKCKLFSPGSISVQCSSILISLSIYIFQYISFNWFWKMSQSFHSGVFSWHVFFLTKCNLDNLSNQSHAHKIPEIQLAEVPWSTKIYINVPRSISKYHRVPRRPQCTWKNLQVPISTYKYCHETKSS